MNKTVPTVSIGLPVYNGERHLRSAVDSLLQQTFGMQKLDRARAASRQMVGAGNMVFGLFRTSNLAKTTVYPKITNPDRLLMLDLPVQGTYYQVDKYRAGRVGHRGL